ncbi:MAG: tannase [Clostridia bacterium]|nr:tannase [Clostridia bacterium]
MKVLALALAAVMLLTATGCSAQAEAVTDLAKIDNTAWLYNADDDVYYQIGISYCENPADEKYETLAIFVPGAYMNATDNGDGTYTCEINPDGKVGSYTAEIAPIVMPINTPGYSAMTALTSYSSFTEYMEEGFVYVHAGCRGRDAGAPAGVTDLKAAVRYIRYSDEGVPGNAESIFTFGMSGGGAQSALMGSTGDSALYDPYLEQIGAVSGVSDAVLGSMCWCPITNLDSADEAYEWMMGVTRSGLSEENQQISDRLAAAFAEYINSAGIKDPAGEVLTLSESSQGIYQAGSYYDYMKTVIEGSLNNFLSDTTFPYDASASSGGMGGFGGGRGGRGNFGGGERPFFGDGQRPDGGEGMPDFGSREMPDGGQMPDGGFTEQSYEDIDDITRNETTSGVSLTGTYEKPQDYIDALNANNEWVIYDADTNTVTITSIEDFVLACKSASKNLGAFDQLDGGQGENTLFGYGDGSGAHFDAYLAAILEELGSEYAASYAADLEKRDSAGNTVDYRVKMYTPLYYLLESSEGYQTSTVAKYWRIRTGIAQGDCALSTEMNLALALQNYEGVESVDFETIWGAGHTQAERTGNSTENFIAWVHECMASQ